MIQHINWTEQSVEMFDWNCLQVNPVHQRLWGITILVSVQRVHPLRHGFDSKWPEHGVNHLRPVAHAMEEQSARTKSKLLVPIFYDAILMMSTNSTKGY